MPFGKMLVATGRTGLLIATVLAAAPVELTAQETEPSAGEADSAAQETASPSPSPVWTAGVNAGYYFLSGSDFERVEAGPGLEASARLSWPDGPSLLSIGAGLRFSTHNIESLEVTVIALPGPGGNFHAVHVAEWPAAPRAVVPIAPEGTPADDVQVLSLFLAPRYDARVEGVAAAPFLEGRVGYSRLSAVGDAGSRAGYSLGGAGGVTVPVSETISVAASVLFAQTWYDATGIEITGPKGPQVGVRLGADIRLR